MSYEEKLEAIEAEIAAMEEEDYPEDIIEAARTPIMEEHEVFLMERLEEDLNNYDWWNEGGGLEEVESRLRERMLRECCTPEELAEGELLQKQAVVDRIQARFDEALSAAMQAQKSIDEAFRRDKPKMLRHYTEIKQRHEATAAEYRKSLALARAAVA
jgi:hypothetical protein